MIFTPTLLRDLLPYAAFPIQVGKDVGLGLTKFEYMASHIMGHLLTVFPSANTNTIRDNASLACVAAHALIMEINKYAKQIDDEEKRRREEKPNDVQAAR